MVLSSLLLTTAGMIGCGGSTNPTDGFQKVVSKQTVPADQAKKPVSQLLVSNDFYTISVDKLSVNHDLLFYEGQNNHHTFTVKFMVPNVQYNLVWVEAEQGQVAGSQPPKGTPATAYLKQSDSDPDTWDLFDQIPEVDLVDNEVEKTFLIHLRIDVASSTDPNSQNVLNKISKTSEVEGIELHTTQSPVIQAINGALDIKTSKSVDENSQADVTIEVTDPGSGNSVPPQLAFYEGASDNQQKYADGQTLLRFKNGSEKPTSLGGDKWEYHLILDAQDSKIDHNHLSYQATFQVLSRTGLKSPAIVTHFAVNPTVNPTVNSATNSATNSKPAPAPVKPAAKKNHAAKTNAGAAK